MHVHGTNPFKIKYTFKLTSILYYAVECRMMSNTEEANVTPTTKPHETDIELPKNSRFREQVVVWIYQLSTKINIELINTLRPRSNIK